MEININSFNIEKFLDLSNYTTDKRNLVCSDFFKWNFEEWRPYTEEELKKLKKK